MKFSLSSKESQESPGRLADSISRLSERLEHMMDKRAVAGRASSPPVSDDEWSKGIDDAVAEIVGRQRSLDEGAMADLARTRKPATARTAARPPAPQPSLEGVSGLERHLRQISQQIETLRRPSLLDADVGSLRRDLADIKRTLSEAMPRLAVDVIEDQVRALSSRVENGRDGPDGVALASIELRLARVHETLNRLAPAENLTGLQTEVGALSRKIDAVAAKGTDRNTMQQLEEAIVELRRVSERVASGDVLTKLANEVRAVSEKVDRFDTAVAGNDAVSALERRMEMLGGALTEYAASVGQRAIPDVEVLSKTVSDRLERLHTVRAEQASIDQLEAHIVRLTEKLDASDSRMAQIGGLERTIADLFLQIEDTRTGASDSERRTQQTLQDVHDAIERIVDRIGDREARSAGSAAKAPDNAPIRPDPLAERPASSAARTPAAERVPVTPPPAPRAARTRSEDAQTTPPPAAAEPAAKPQDSLADRRPIDPSLPADTPLEPGSGLLRGRTGPTAAERIAASEAALGPTPKSDVPPRTEKANFIAAARRAAQAAAADAASTDPLGDAAAEPRGGGLAQVLGKHKRSLILAILIAGLAASAVEFGPQYRAVLDGLGFETARDARDAAAARDDTAALPADAPMTLAKVPASPLALAPAPAANAANDAAAPAPTTSAGIPPGLMPMKYAGDVTGSLAKPQNTASLTASAPAALLAPPAVTPLDAGNLPVSIGSAQLRSAAANGDPAAAYEIAVRFAEGRGAPLSLEEAARWFGRAADHDLAPAQYRLGSLYEKGHGVKKDTEAARRLYIAAANKGNAKAMHNLAVLYAEGIDGKPDYRTASQWFRKAAERGVADSQYNLGVLFARGIGTEQNLAESYKWFTLAANQGDQDAGRKRDDVATRLEPQSLAAAKLAAQTFVAEPQPDEAINVKAPAGGWDRPTAATTPPKAKSAAKKFGSL